MIWNSVTLHLYFVSKEYTAVFIGGEKSVFFKTMKRPLVWKNPEIWIDSLFLFLVYCLSSAAMKSELDTFFLRKKKKYKTALIKKGKNPMCSRLAILKVGNTSATKSSEQKGRGEQSVTPKASLALLSFGSLVATASRAPSPRLSCWEMVLEHSGRPGEFDIFSLYLLPHWSDCHWCVSDRDLWCPFCSEILVPDPALLMPFPNLLWSSSVGSNPRALCSHKKSPPPTKVEWNTKYWIPLRKERDVFILFCLFLYELEVFSNPVCWLQ